MDSVHVALRRTFTLVTWVLDKVVDTSKILFASLANKDFRSTCTHSGEASSLAWWTSLNFFKVNIKIQLYTYQLL